MNLRFALAVALTALAARAATADDAPAVPAEVFSVQEVKTDGAIVGISYQAIAGNLVVHPRGWSDVKDKENKDNPTAEASMFFVAYVKKGADAQRRPVTFLYNGGPGSASVWLHMGSFGPRRVVTDTDRHLPMAPYRLIENESTLLDTSDLVFIDAPGTGYSRIAGKDKEKAFFGVDADAYAFSQFIQQWLGKYGRWNSPKYLFGESYGTPRSAVLINLLQSEAGVDFNGVMLLSQILNFDLSADDPDNNPGVDEPYILVLPTYAATAWYHHRLPHPPQNLPALLREAEAFATGDYAAALQAGASLDDARRRAVAEKLHEFTGLGVDYILKSDLRIGGGEFAQTLQDSAGVSIGRLDSRFSGPHMDPLAKEDPDNDPFLSAIQSAYVSAFNDYVRRALHYPGDAEYHAFSSVGKWDYAHRLPGQASAQPSTPNVMPDMAAAMKQNPNLHVLLMGGYYDLGTPYFEGKYEMAHLPMPRSLQANIAYHYYASGHMVYANPEMLKRLHADVAEFIRSTSRTAE